MKLQFVNSINFITSKIGSEEAEAGGEELLVTIDDATTLVEVFDAAVDAGKIDGEYVDHRDVYACQDGRVLEVHDVDY